MNNIFDRIKALANTNPSQIAVQTGFQSICYVELASLIDETMAFLKKKQPKIVALYAENTLAWVVVDLACQALGICLLPLPTFFSEEQLKHAMKRSSADFLLMGAESNCLVLTRLLTIKEQDLCIAGETLAVYSSPIVENVDHFPKGTGKITFTSGSTGKPKGVCLSNQHIVSIASSLEATLNLPKVRHLNLLPLSTLLENIAGVYVPLLSGGTIVLLTAKETGLQGSSGLNVQALLRRLNDSEPESLILIPELLRVLFAAVQQGWVAPRSLKFIAVGGAKVSAQLIYQSRAVGLPVYEGYGLSECASVVCLNTPGNHRVGSVGKALGHTELSIVKGEVVIKKPIFLGYLNQPESWYPRFFRTGDLASQDKWGFIQIEGRKKNILISSFGRNISPEWLESELLNHFFQAIVFGDGQPFCIALLRPHSVGMSDHAIEASIDLINQKLPDYAHIKQWLKLKEPLSIKNGLLTETGKPKRVKIYQYYQTQITQLYKGE